MYTLLELQTDRDLWNNLKIIPVKCTWCTANFEIKFGTLYNIIRRNANGVFCTRKCAGAFRANMTQEKYKSNGGKICKRCNEFKELNCFSPLPNAPYLRSECYKCHNYKPARKYSLLREKVLKNNCQFSLSLDNFIEAATKNCFYCDASMKTLNLEILNPTLGYIDQNVISCCKTCFKFKNDLTHDAFIELCLTIANNLRGNNE